MGWFSKIFNSSKHKVVDGRYDKRKGAVSLDDHPYNSDDALGETEDIDRAIALSLVQAEQEGKKLVDFDSQVNEDEQLAIALQESLICQSPPSNSNSIGTLNGHGHGPGHGHGHGHGPGNGLGHGHGHGGGNMYQQPMPFLWSTGVRICAGCNTQIVHGRFLSCMGADWHPECFRCRACNQPICDNEFSTFESYPHHKACYREHCYPKCDVCKHLIPVNSSGFIEYRAHPFWSQKYCPVHEHDGTPRCCSCERLEPRDIHYVALDDGRKLCLECLDSAIMGTNECQPLYIDIQEFYESLNMKVEQQVPLLLVERQALNEALGGEKHGHHHMPETRGLCLSEEQTVSTVSRRPRVGTGNRAVDMRTEQHKLTRRCEVTAILILYGLPRLLTGSILAHEMMHAWLRLRGYRTLSQDVEEGICQVLAHMWLESQGVSTPQNNVTTSTASSSSYASRFSNQREQSPFERKLGEFFKHQIESDTSPIYGDGYRAAKQAVVTYGLERTLDHMHMTGTFPY